jgi:hypothetical protein
VPKGKYLVLAYTKFKEDKLLGTTLEIEVLDPLPDRLKKLKGLPLSAEKLGELKDIVEVDGKKLGLFRDGGNHFPNPEKYKKKVPYELNFSIREIQDRKYIPITNIKPKLNVFIVSSDDKIVTKKKVELGDGSKPMADTLPPGSYLVIAWIDYKKDVKIGEIFYFFLP